MPTLFDPIDVGVIANRICRAALPKIYRSVWRWTLPLVQPGRGRLYGLCSGGLEWFRGRWNHPPAWKSRQMKE